MSIEDIVLKYSCRGMDLLRPYLPKDFCSRAALKIVNLKNPDSRERIILATGFYVRGFAETDGPLGVYVLAKVLEGAGFEPVIVTDRYCRDFFEPEGWKVIYMETGTADMYTDVTEQVVEIIDKMNPVCLISVERCGENIHGDYTNMRGISIRKNTAPVDKLFVLAKNRGIFTVGIGDGGNEIGMGNLKKQISKKLALVPCSVCTDVLMIATVSNWGAYGLAAEIAKVLQKKMPLWEQVHEFLKRIVDIGCVDGVIGEQNCSIDGFDLSKEKEIYEECAKSSRL